MTFSIDEAFLPATLTAPPMTDEEFTELCAEHPDLFFEMTAEGELIVMPPTYTLTGARNAKIAGQLYFWAKEDQHGVATDAAAGFVLPNGARRSPGAAWTLKSRLEALSERSFEGFWHLAPDFVIELKSRTDRLRVLRAKMHEWIDNGAQFAWMIDPETRTVEVYRPHSEPETHTAIDSIAGEGPLAGFTLDLTPVWNPIAM